MEDQEKLVFAGAFFGEVLQYFRRHKGLKGWTQSVLAEKMDLHRNTISSWEKGEKLPEYGVVLKLAEVLHLDEVERRLLLEARYGTASIEPLHCLPFERNLYFTGREEVLHALHRQLTMDKCTAITQAISGLGGIGKTQLALEYAYRYQKSYHDIFWAGAETNETLTNAFVRFAERLNLPQKQDRDEQRIVKAMQSWFQQHSKWLLILDNAESPALLKKFLPPRQHGTVILTTRSRNLGGNFPPLVLDCLPEEDGMLFLLLRANRLDHGASLNTATAIDSERARTTVHALGGLPLALDQAGAYIRETGCSLDAYQRLYEARHADLLKKRGISASDHPDSVTTTFHITFTQAESQQPAAIEVLRLCAFLHPDAIPEEMITAGVSHLPASLHEIATNPIAFNELLRLLQDFSLLQRDNIHATLTVHRLVQVVIKDMFDEETLHQWAERVILVMNTTLAGLNWQQSEKYIAHALVCAGLITSYDIASVESFQLLRQTANILHHRARFAEADLYYRQMLALHQRLVGTEHPDIAGDFDSLAMLLWDQGKYWDAEARWQEALALRERALGDDHSDTIMSMNNLARLYRDLGKYQKAEALYTRVLAAREHLFGPDHPETLSTASNLAGLYHVQGFSQKATPLDQRALPLITTDVQRVADLDITPYLWALEVLCFSQGKHEKAEALCQRALAMCEQIHGPDHPTTGKFLNFLARTYREQERCEEALPLCQRALTIYERVFGQEHIVTTTAINNLAWIYNEQGKLELAEPLAQQALEIRERLLDPTHQDIAYSLNNLADICRKQGKYQQAEMLCQRALEVFAQQRETQHLVVALSLFILANIYRDQGRYQEAEPLYQQTLSTREQALGPDHRFIAITLEAYALLLRKMSRDHEALSLETQARAIRAKL